MDLEITGLKFANFFVQKMEEKGGCHSSQILVVDYFSRHQVVNNRL